ncbi:MAG: SRPBCC family protein, partial [Jatrophihabitans sp.]|uniref:SRPBCC family protein n=1 Tax=Jatrophihabitans sp. TaxID=1932789 RepID=UPI003F811403
MADTSTGLTDTVAAPVEQIIATLTDFESFPEWQAAVMECEVLERDAEGRGSRVRMKVDAKVKKVGYVVRYTYDLPNGLRWDQESG